MLQGDRVVLRSFERRDLEPFWEMGNDLEVESRASGWRPVPTTLAEVEARFEKRTQDPPTDLVDFTVEVDGEFVGRAGLWGIDEHSRVAQLGISIRRRDWGKGYGQDAVRTIVAYAFRHLNLRKICLEVLADDERAVAAYRAAGFIEEGRLRAHQWFDGEYRDALVMAVLRGEWKPG
jgi:RimJ/RimL family protein N-acetyltransferase